MILNSSTKSARCIGSSLASAARRALLVFGQDHLAHRADAVLVEEHVLGAAEPDALGAEFDRGARVGRRVGIGAHFQLARARRPISSAWRIRRRAPARASAPCRRAPVRSSRRW